MSGPSTITADSKFTFDKEFSSYTVNVYEKDIVLTVKYSPVTLSRQDYDNFIKVRLSTLF